MEHGVLVLEFEAHGRIESELSGETQKPQI